MENRVVLAPAPSVVTQTSLGAFSLSSCLPVLSLTSSPSVFPRFDLFYYLFLYSYYILRYLGHIVASPLALPFSLASIYFIIFFYILIIFCDIWDTSLRLHLHSLFALLSCPCSSPPSPLCGHFNRFSWILHSRPCSSPPSPLCWHFNRFSWILIFFFRLRSSKEVASRDRPERLSEDSSISEKSRRGLERGQGRGGQQEMVEEVLFARRCPFPLFLFFLLLSWNFPLERDRTRQWRQGRLLARHGPLHEKGQERHPFAGQGIRSSGREGFSLCRCSSKQSSRPK